MTSEREGLIAPLKSERSPAAAQSEITRAQLAPNKTFYFLSKYSSQPPNRKFEKKAKKERFVA